MFHAQYLPPYESCGISAANQELLREQATRAVRFGGAGAITVLLSWRPTVFQRFCRAEYSCCRLNKRMSS